MDVLRPARALEPHPCCFTVRDRPRSRAAFQAAQELFPGGVNSPVRAFGAVGGEPPVIDRGSGAYIYDLDGNAYADYVCAYGPLILGHAHPAVVGAIRDAAAAGMAFGAPTELETALARRVVAAVPSIEQVRFVNSGTEATMTAIRLARGYTGRNKLIKFAGCYHGHASGLLARSGSGLATLGLPASAGVPASYAAETLVAPYNDLASVERIVGAYADDLAAVIVEPVAANMGLVPPLPGFLEGLRELTLSAGALLIFDEVITGFRLSRGGAQAQFGVTPDLTCLGKIIGGGLPIGAVGGPAAIMQHLAPLGAVYQAGTLAGNTLAMAAGIATLDELSDPGIYDLLDRRASRLASAITAAARRADLPVAVSRAGSLLTVFFQAEAPTDLATAQASDTEAYARFCHAALAAGVNVAPSQFEAMFVSLAHTNEVIAFTEAAVAKALDEAARSR